MMRDFSKLMLGLLLLVSSLMISCKDQFADVNSPDREREESLRMPFNQRAFILNSTDKSRIYEIEYNFQGLQGKATLNDIGVELPKGGHMCVSPDNKSLTVVAYSEDFEGRSIYIVDLDTKDVKEIKLLNHDPNGVVPDKDHYDENRFTGKITQVDIDQEGYLFLAGKAGFYRVVADNGNGTVDPTKVNGGDIWNDKDKTLKDDDVKGQVWAHVAKYTLDKSNFVETLEDGEDYFDEVTTLSPKKAKFLGGDILFTQNSDETNGFEQQRLISFSQMQGNTAIALDLKWDWPTISFNAGKLFGGSGSEFHKKAMGDNGKKVERVTGACLIGDNHVMTSHHKNTALFLWNLHGEKIAEVEMEGGFIDDGKGHNWGDMASTQSFDHLAGETTDGSNKEIFGDRKEDWYHGAEKGHQYAEIKLFRAGNLPNKSAYDVADLDDNGGVPAETRGNAANADIADYRKNGNRFVSLGKTSGDKMGVALLKFATPVKVANGVLQVVETSHNKAAEYDSKGDANDAYHENATVYVSTSTQRYYDGTFDANTVWVEVGNAHISNNEFSLSGVAELNADDEISWVKIVSAESKSGKDGFDINFVAAYEEPIILPASETGLACDITAYDFIHPSKEMFLDGVDAFQIPSADQLEEFQIFGSIGDSKVEFDGITLQENGRKDPLAIGLAVFKIDGRLHGYEILNNCKVRGLSSQSWGEGGTNMADQSLLAMPKGPTNPSYLGVTDGSLYGRGLGVAGHSFEFVSFDGTDIIGTISKDGSCQKFVLGTNSKYGRRVDGGFRYSTMKVDPVNTLIIPQLSACGVVGESVDATKYLWCGSALDGLAVSAMQGTDVYQLKNGTGEAQTFTIGIYGGPSIETIVPANSWFLVKGVAGGTINVRKAVSASGTEWSKGGTASLGATVGTCPSAS
ncbi:hypothetical protein [Persicobacter psychrovividus]|uniref:Uncharacterized protein n=1 Tax=Persicobacter psychrovividus TaxID=387638 RepID=A0ABM7VG85_9BACT|nr:hypothetical protein PEPS_22550 [Persicobacter psychrovividus]